MDEDSLRHGIWYPDEEICRAKEAQKLKWVRVQRQIAKLHKQFGVEGYFTYDMLNRIKLVRKGIKGRNPALPPVERRGLMQ